MFCKVLKYDKTENIGEHITDCETQSNALPDVIQTIIPQASNFNTTPPTAHY